MTEPHFAPRQKGSPDTPVWTASARNRLAAERLELAAWSASSCAVRAGGASMTFYVTTAIPYVNAPPHLGHALELVQADVLARHRRLRGQPVRLLTGTHDNAFKNVPAARAAGVDVRTFVDANAARFAALREPLTL